jgi:hypothetical protein
MTTTHHSAHPFYRRDGETVGVAIIGASSLVHARMRVALDGIDVGLDFAEGYRLDAKMAPALKPMEIGRMLSPSEARKLLDRFERS